MISAKLVKELRDRTGAGMMDCKKALEATDGNIEEAITWLQEKGISTAAKKAGRIAAEGLAKVVVEGNTGVVLELNAETDFVAKNDKFTGLLDSLASTFVKEKPADLEAANNLVIDGSTVADLVTQATATIGEKISLRRLEVVEKNDDEIFGDYTHMGGKIAALVVLKGGNDEVSHDVAMQVASMSPQFISRDDMPQEIVDKETDIQTEVLKNDESMANKPENIRAGIVAGRVKKALQEISLVDQPFFKDSSLSVDKMLNNANAKVVSFVRYAVGEGIEKREENFAEEIASMTQAK
ncbi:MAG: elongation factor Ts [Erysipelothrix sp.]|nr:elongation factor Ts [Erysipelothrix sp.]